MKLESANRDQDRRFQPIAPRHQNDFQESLAHRVPVTEASAGRLLLIPLPSRSAVERHADQIYTVCFGDIGDHGGNAVRRTLELPSFQFHVDGSIAAMSIRYRDELARMRELHSPEDLRDIARAGAEVVEEAVTRADITGFLPQFDANIFAGMYRKSQEILQDRGIVESGDVHGPDREMPEWNPGNRTQAPGPLEFGGLGDWQPGQLPNRTGSRDHGLPDHGLPDDFMRNGPMPETDFDRIGAELDAMQWPARPTGSPTAPGRVPSDTFMAEAARQSWRRFFEEAEEAAREAIERALGNSAFTSGQDPIERAIEEHGWAVELFLHALWPQVTPGPGGGAPRILPGPSSATANSLRHLDPQAAAMLVAQLATRLSDVPELYREALREALGNGDAQDEDIMRAMKLLDGVSASGGNESDTFAPLTADARELLEMQIERGRMTMEQFEYLRALNPHLRDTILIHRIGRHNLGDTPEGLRLSEADPLPETDRAADIAPPADLVHSWEDIRTLLAERYGMRLSDGSIHAAQRRLARHSEAEMCALVNAAIPYLDRIEEAYPGLLRGIALDIHTPNPRGIGPTMPIVNNGMTNIANGTTYLMSPQDMRIAYRDRPIDGDTKFMLTLYHEIGHAIASKAPIQANDFMRNLVPVLEIRGPESTNAGPDAVTMDEALAILFPHLDTERAYERLWQFYPVRIDDVELLEMEGSGAYVPPRQEYFGTLQVYRKLPVGVCEVLGIGVSGYAGKSPEEALAEAFGHDFADRPYQRFPDAQLPRLVEAMRGPLPGNLQCLLARMIHVARSRDAPIEAPPYPEFQGGGAE
ncbi:MAG: hypothetical protein JJU21_07795 [Salinarimonas sp.]|nr:hypothetical protein [Salinarimonas sp.]